MLEKIRTLILPIVLMLALGNGVLADSADNTAVTLGWSNDTHDYSLTNYSDSKGFYNISITSDDIDVYSGYPNYYDISESFSISPGEDKETNLTLSPVETNVTISGTVKDQDGTAVDEEEVIASWMLDDATGYNYSTMDASGDYSVDVLGERNVTLQVRKKGYFLNSTQIEVGTSDETVNITLEKAPAFDAWVNGTVTDTEGNPIENATVSTTWYDMNEGKYLMNGLTNRTDENGNYAIPVPEADGEADGDNTYIEEVTASAAYHFRNTSSFTNITQFDYGESTPVNQDLTLEAIPERDASVHGYVILGDGNTSDENSTDNSSGGGSGTDNAAPDAPTDPTPEDGATGLSTDPDLIVNVSDPDGDSMNVTFYDASDDSEIGMDEDVYIGVATISWNGLDEGATYSWYAEADDGTNTTQSSTWSFTTNKAPTAGFSYSPENPSAGQEITFNGTRSSDDDGNIVSYEWDWTNDGHYENSGNITSHTYPEAGEYDAKLRITDNAGATDTIVKTLSVSETGPETIIVDIDGSGDYTNITDALDNATSEDTIIINSGKYNESVEIDAPLTLIGNDTGSGIPVVNATGSGSPFTINADNIIIRNFTITGSGSSDGDAGILVISSNNNTIQNNNITQNGAYGIFLTENSKDNIILVF